MKTTARESPIEGPWGAVHGEEGRTFLKNKTLANPHATLLPGNKDTMVMKSMAQGQRSWDGWGELHSHVRLFPGTTQERNNKRMRKVSEDFVGKACAVSIQVGPRSL